MKNCLWRLIPLILLTACATGPPAQEPVPEVFYPAPPQRPRIQYLYTISGQAHIGPTQSTFNEFLLGKPQSEIRIGKPYDIESTNGKIYVLDRRYRKILILDLAARRLEFLMDQRLGALANPSGIHVTPDEVKYVADMQRRQIVVFDRDNRFERTYGDGELFEKPVDVAVFRQEVFVCDMDKDRIVVLDKDSGAVRRFIGEKGVQPGRFNKPSHIVVDHQGNLFVNDAFNFRVQKFDAAGDFVISYGYLGDNLGAFARPKGIDVDRDGHIYVADAAFENVQIFDDETGEFLLFFGGSGAASGSMYLPSGVHIDYANVGFFSNYLSSDFKLEYLIWVGNMFGQDKLNVYGFGEWIGGRLDRGDIGGDRP